LRDIEKGFSGLLEKEILLKKIPAGIACDAKLRQHQEFGLNIIGLINHLFNFYTIEITIADPELRASGRNPDKLESSHRLTHIHQTSLLIYNLFLHTHSFFSSTMTMLVEAGRFYAVHSGENGQNSKCKK
jgi:hypothetical protein